MTIGKCLAAIERMDEAAQEWLAAGLLTWLRAGGDVPLSRCLGLPGSAAGLRRMLRDHYLREAFWLAPGATAEEKYQAIEAELGPLMTWKWTAWRRRGVPAYATEIERLLFRAIEADDMPGPRWRRELVLGRFFPEKLPSEGDTTIAVDDHIETHHDNVQQSQ